MADKQKRGVPPAAWIIAAVAALGGAGFWYLEKSGPPPEEQVVLTGDAKAYVRNLKLADVEMKAAESYLKQPVVEITGKLGNAGDRVLKRVEIRCVFYDPYGQVVLRERVAIAGHKGGPLNPGETRDFRLAFDNVPESWNQALPQLVIARIIFG